MGRTRKQWLEFFNGDEKAMKLYFKEIGRKGGQAKGNRSGGEILKHNKHIAVQLGKQSGRIRRSRKKIK